MNNKSKATILLVSASLLFISMIFCIANEEMLAVIISMVSCMIGLLAIYFEMIDLKG